MRSDAFKAAVESGDADAFVEVLAPDAVFFSPAVYRPYEGREAVMVVLRAVVQVLEDFRYEDRFEAEDGEVLLFAARVGDRRLSGVDILRFDDEGRVRELTVMIRPLSGLNAVVEGMGRELERMGVLPAAG
jgi:hypothetical protein